MIRFALFCTILTFVGFKNLPVWRAELTAPFFQACLRNTPNVRNKSEIQSLVCGSSLQIKRHASTQIQQHASTQIPRASNEASGVIEAWRNLGLIHILVVSGGHLSILAAMLSLLLSRITRSKALVGKPFTKTAATIVTVIALTLFALQNRLQPPVFRALLEWFARKPLERRGWRGPETALFTSWIALPFCSSIYDLLSLALSFFASVTVEQTIRSLHRHRWLAALALQTAVWWILLPFVFTMGVPHPLTSMLNVLLAPLLGATLIPFAILAGLSGWLPPIVNEGDPIGLGTLFDFVWEKVSIVLVWLADVLPAASSRIEDQKPLMFGFQYTAVLLFAVLFAIGAMLLRSRRERRRESVGTSRFVPATIVALATILAIVVHLSMTK